jgi:hypothetical protein
MDNLTIAIIVLFPSAIIIALGLVLAVTQTIGRCKDAYKHDTDTSLPKILAVIVILGGLGLLLLCLSIFQYSVTYLYQNQVDGVWLIYGILLLLFILLVLVPTLAYCVGRNHGFRLAQAREEDTEEDYEDSSY